MASGNQALPPGSGPVHKSHVCHDHHREKRSKCPKNEAHELPSWVPDWTSFKGGTCFLTFPPLEANACTEDRYAYQAPGQERGIVEFREGKRVLRASAIRFDSIISTGGAYESLPIPNDDVLPRHLCNWYSNIAVGDHSQPHDQSYVGCDTDTLWTAFNRTVAATR
jgi:hypothetical protein